MLTRDTDLAHQVFAPLGLRSEADHGVEAVQGPRVSEAGCGHQGAAGQGRVQEGEHGLGEQRGLASLGGLVILDSDLYLTHSIGENYKDKSVYLFTIF